MKFLKVIFRLLSSSFKWMSYLAGMITIIGSVFLYFEGRKKHPDEITKKKDDTE